MFKTKVDRLSEIESGHLLKMEINTQYKEDQEKGRLVKGTLGAKNVTKKNIKQCENYYNSKKNVQQIDGRV